jgi:long-chain acyl-CoA synthetase
MKRTVLAMLEEAERLYPTSQYVRRREDTGWVGLTFGEVRAQARLFAAWLLEKGLKKGEAAAVVAEGSPQWVIGEFGILMAGCVSVPLSIKLLAEEIPFRLAHSEARVVLTTRHQLDKVLAALTDRNAGAVLVVTLDDASEAADTLSRKRGYPRDRIVGFSEALEAGRLALAARSAELDRVAADTAEDDTVTICYTSGTTGDPKGIMLTNLNYWTNCHDAVQVFPEIQGFTSLVILPVDHSFAHTVAIYTSLLCRLCLSFVDSRGGPMGTLRSIPVNLLEVEPNFVLTVPALSGNFMRKIIAGVHAKGGFIGGIFERGIAAGIARNGNGHNRVTPGARRKTFFPALIARLLVFGAVKRSVFGRNIRFCVGGGALLDLKQQEFYAALGVPIYQGYGLTEASPIISANTPSLHKFGTSGAVFPSVECTIRRPDGTLCPAWETGEIVIRGDSVMKGYFKNPEATAKAIRDGWLWTGDLAFMDPDGFLVVVGREKALLISDDGEKYSPEEIEEAVATSTDVVSQIMVYNDHRKYTTALVELDADAVKRLIAAKGIRSAAALLDAVEGELTRFSRNPKAKKVPAAWTPTTFGIVAEPFSEKNGTVNSTMKLVRHKADKVYREDIEYLYGTEGSKTANPRNRATLARLFELPQ